MNTGQALTQRRLPRFSLRSLLLLLIPLGAWLAAYGHVYRQKVCAANAFRAICNKGVDANFGSHHAIVIYFTNGNVTDDDLEAFIPAFNDYCQVGRIKRLKLNGSNVSVAALKQFRRAVPDCAVDP